MHSATKPEIAIEEIDRIRAAGCGLAACSRTLARLSAPFRQASARAACSGRSGSHARRQCSRPASGCCSHERTGASHATMPFRAKTHAVRRTCSLAAAGGASLGGRAAKPRLRPGSRPCACGSLTGHAARGTAICLVKRSG